MVKQIWQTSGALTITSMTPPVMHAGYRGALGATSARLGAALSPLSGLAFANTTAEVVIEQRPGPGGREACRWPCRRGTWSP